MRRSASATLQRLKTTFPRASACTASGWAFTATRLLRQSHETDGGIEADDILVVEEVIEPTGGGGGSSWGGRWGGTQQYQEGDGWEGETIAGNSGTNTTTTSPSLSEVDTIDAYARARVSNYIKRHSPGADSANYVQVKNIESHDGMLYHASIVLPMPDEQYGRRVAEGIAGTAKDAEHLAAMHAERIINCLGLQLYGLPSSQERYALQLRKTSNGKLWAPLPSDRPKDFSTPSPPLLQMNNSKSQTVSSSPSSGRQEFTLTCRSSSLSTSLDYALASPNFLDPNAQRRFKSYIADHGKTIGKVSKMIKLKEAPVKVQKAEPGPSKRQLPRMTSKEKAYREHLQIKADERDDEFEFEEWDKDPSQLQFADEKGDQVRLDDSKTQQGRKGSKNFSQVRHDTTTSDVIHQERGQWYLCQLTIPNTPPEVGEVVAMGRAPDTRLAMQLACMHAELLIDALGLQLFSNTVDQIEHSRECQQVGRWAMVPQQTQTFGTSKVMNNVANTSQVTDFRSIKPLQFTLDDLSQHGAATTTAGHVSTTTTAADGTRTSVINDGSATPDRILSHAKVLDSLTLQFNNVDFQDHSARSKLRAYLERMSRQPVDTGVGVGGAQLLCPTTGRIKFFTEKFGYGQNCTYRSSMLIPMPNQKQHGQRVACGVGPTEETAECLCAMHALQILGELQVPVYDDPTEQKEYHIAMTACGGAAAHYVEATREELITELANRYPPIDNTSSGDEPFVHEIGNLTHVPTPPLFKLVCRDKKGRIFFGASREEESVEWGHLNERKPTEAAYETMLQNGQRLSHRDYWALTPDAAVEADLYADLPPSAANPANIVGGITFGPSGTDRIIVPPNTQLDAARMYLHTLSGARHFDSKAIDRLHDYLERNGRPLGSYHTGPFTEGEGQAKRTLYRVTVPLPVPSHFGLRIAVGEAPTAELALRCAATHAELTLDAIGVRLYDHDIYQRRHAESARQTGRWAPLPETFIPFDAAHTFPSPPAVRLEEEESAVWQQVQGLKHRNAANEPVGDVTPESELDAALADEGFEFLKNVGMDENDEINAGVGGVGDSSPEGLSDDAMDLSRYEAILNSKVRISARNKVEHFFHFHGSDSSRMDRWSAKPKGSRSSIFFASLVMPFPPEYGLRVARGAAMNRRDAMVICYSHALRMIDALYFQVSTQFHVQMQHRKQAREEGRDAPTPQNAPFPPSTPTSFGLKCVAEVVEQQAPQIPSAAEASTSHNGDPFEAWFTYARRCDMYILQKQENDLVAAAGRNQTPRTGVEFEDEAIAAVEKFKISRTAILSLKDYSRNHGFEVPDKFDVESIGTGVDKKYYARTQVIGTPYIAHGLCEQRHDAICLAAMHYQQIINKVLMTNLMAKAGVIGGAVGGGDDSAGGADMLFDPVQQTFTTVGKRTSVRFYSELMPPHKLVKETIKRPLTAAEDQHHFVVTLEYEDAVGLKQVVKHEVKKSKVDGEEDQTAITMLKAGALEKCYNDIFGLLSNKQTFTTFLQLIKQHPRIRLSMAIRASLVSKELTELNEKVKAALLAINGADGSVSVSSAAPTARPLVPGSDLDDPSYLEKLERDSLLGRLAAMLKSRNPQSSEGVSKPEVGQALPFLKNEVMREEHAQLLAAYLSQRPLGDVAAFAQEVTHVIGRTDAASTKGVDELLDAVDEAFVDTAGRTVVDLNRSNFVVSFNVSYAEVQKLMANSEATTTESSIAVASNFTAGTPESLVRQEELTVALPTLFGAITTLVASRLCKQHTSSAEGESKAAASPPSRASIDMNISLAKLLVAAALMPNSGVYDCAVTAVAAQESDLAEDPTANQSVAGGANQPRGATLADRCIRLTLDTIASSQHTASQSKKLKHIALSAQRRAIHGIVLQSLKDLRGQLAAAFPAPAAPPGARLPSTPVAPTHGDLSKLRALITAVEGSFNSTNNATSTRPVQQLAAGGATNLRAATQAAAVPKLFEMCVGMATIPQFKLEMVSTSPSLPQHTSEAASSADSITTDLTSIVAASTSILPKKAEHAATLATGMAGGIDYGKYPIGSSLPNGGKVRVVPQVFGLPLYASDAKPAQPQPQQKVVAQKFTASAVTGGGGWSATIGKKLKENAESTSTARHPIAAPTTRASETSSSNSKPSRSVHATIQLPNPGQADLSSQPTHTQMDIAFQNPLALYVLASPAVAKPSSDGLHLGVIDGVLPIFAESQQQFAAVERLRHAVTHYVSTATPIPVPIVTLLTAIMQMPGEVTSAGVEPLAPAKARQQQP